VSGITNFSLINFSRNKCGFVVALRQGQGS